MIRDTQTPGSFPQVPKSSPKHFPAAVPSLHRLPAHRAAPCSLFVPTACTFAASSTSLLLTPLGAVPQANEEILFNKEPQATHTALLQARFAAFKGRERKQQRLRTLTKRDPRQHGPTSPIQLGLGNAKDHQAGKCVRKGPGRLQN